MSETSARFALPLIMPGQAQKELFHNEALAAIDAALHAAVEGAPQAAPPAAPVEGQCWLVGPDATGAWTGRDGSLAAWTSGGWRFVTPQPGMCAWDGAAGVPTLDRWRVERRRGRGRGDPGRRPASRRHPPTGCSKSFWRNDN